MTGLLILIVISLGISFMCSLLEAVLFSVQPAYIAVKMKEGRKFAHLLDHHKKVMDRSIGAILTLNTFANTMGSALIGSKVHALWGETYLTGMSIALTIAILVFAEIVPKRIGSSQWKIFAPITAYLIQIMIFVLYPLVWSIERVSKLFGVSTQQVVSREEMIMTAEIGAKEGSIKQKESAVIKNLLMLDKMYVSDIMTPRSVMFALDETLTVEDVWLKHKPIRYSRIPVYKDSLDNIIGMVHRYRVMEALTHDQDKMHLSELKKPIGCVTENTTVSAVIDYFIKNKEHIALARDEYGVLTGLVSLEDAVETLLGVEIVDELDSVADLRQYALEQWQQRRTQGRIS